MAEAWPEAVDIQPAAEWVDQFHSTVPEASTAMPVQHRIHRSAVRPFFCCGSELSLVSLVDGLDIREISPSRQTDGARPLDCRFKEAASETALSNTTASAEDDCSSSDSFFHRSNYSSHRKKEEKLPRKSKKKSWSLRLRGKLPQNSSNLMVCSRSMDDSPQHQPGCICTAYRKRGEEQEEEGASAAAVSMPANPRANLVHTKSSGMPSQRQSSSPMSLIQVDLGRYAEELSQWELAGKNWEEGDRDVTGAERDRSAEERPRGRVLGATGGHAHVLQVAGEMTPPPIFVSLENLLKDSSFVESLMVPPMVHTQVDYVHCLVPDLEEITKCSFYWGVMDRYEAEKLLENKPEGTFLLRDSAQEDFLFSVSFRRYGRSLHARIEQWNHKFSFDAHDPAVFAADTVCGLIEHYKDPNSCMFFEPMLTNPMIRTYPFSLQHLCRSAVASHCTYDSVMLLPLPACLKEYLQYYHYKQKVRVRRVDLPTIS